MKSLLKVGLSSCAFENVNKENPCLFSGSESSMPDVESKKAWKAEDDWAFNGKKSSPFINLHPNVLQHENCENSSFRNVMQGTDFACYVKKQSVHKCANASELCKTMKELNILDKSKEASPGTESWQNSECIRQCQKKEEPYVSPYTDPVIFGDDLRFAADVTKFDSLTRKSIRDRFHCVIESSRNLFTKWTLPSKEHRVTARDSEEKKCQSDLKINDSPFKPRSVWLQKNIWEPNKEGQYENFNRILGKTHLISTEKRVNQAGDIIMNDPTLKKPKSESKDAQEKCMELFYFEKFRNEGKNLSEDVYKKKRKCYARFEDSNFGAIQMLPTIEPFAKGPLLHLSKTHQNILQGADLVGYDGNPKAETAAEFYSKRPYGLQDVSSNRGIEKCDCDLDVQSGRCGIYKTLHY